VQELNNMINYVIDSNSSLDIKENNDYTITGNGDLVINVYDNVDAKILLKEVNAKLTINLNDYSKLNVIEFNYSKNENEKNVNVSANANFEYRYLSVDSSLEKLRINLNGFKASTNVEYLIINKGIKSSFDQLITHNAKETVSNINNIGLALEAANINFDTVGKINKGMAKSNAVQLSRGIIIGEKASITSQPILKIDEFDVKANHGTAIGRMSDDELFYLMSRGLTKDEAYKLILFGLINPIIKACWDEEEANNYSLHVEKLV